MDVRRREVRGQSAAARVGAVIHEYVGYTLKEQRRLDDKRVRAYVARRFIVRGEYKEYVVFTDRDANEEAIEWKIGFAFFF